MRAQQSQPAAAAPDFPESVVTLPAGAVQIEMGSTYGSTGEIRRFSTGEAVIRAGLGSRIELQVAPASLLWEMSTSNRRVGFQDSGVGLKFALRQFGNGANEWDPALALIVSASLPTGHAYFRSRHALPRAKFIAGWNLTPAVNFTAEAGWARGDSVGVLFDEWNSTASVQASISPRASLYAEYINAGTRRADVGRAALLTGGFTYLLATTVQVDFRAGVRPDNARDETFYHFGIARIF